MTSNAIGAAASIGNADIINFVMGKTNDRSILEFKAIETGGDPKKPFLQGYTPLQLAFMSEEKPLAAIKALCEHGADMKVRDHDGHSMLHWIVSLAG